MHHMSGPSSSSCGRLSCQCKFDPDLIIMLNHCLGSYLNLVQSVTTILEIMYKTMEGQQDQLEHQQQPISPLPSSQRATTSPLFAEEGTLGNQVQGATYNFSHEHRSLLLRLQPLNRTQENLEKCFSSLALRPNQHLSTNNVEFPNLDAGFPYHHTEFSTSIDSFWKGHSLGSRDPRRPTKRQSAQDLSDAVEIFHRCVPDIKQLWTDAIVQQILKGTKTQLKHSSRL